jgi:hypothetical protein
MSSLMIVALAALVIPSAIHFANLRSNKLDSKPGDYILSSARVASG